MTTCFDADRRRALAAAAAVVLGAVAIKVGAASEERVIAVVARKFSFVPDEIHIAQGETVVLELSAPDVIMGFSCHELGVRTDIVPDSVTHVRLTPTKAGRFQFSCDVFCGSGHEDMDGVIVVVAAG